MGTDTNHAIENAQGWLETITAMVKRLEHAESCDAEDRHACSMTSDQLLNAFQDCDLYPNTGPEAFKAYHDSDAAREAITESPLSVEVRSGWFVPSERDADTAPLEYKILLTTGGPALRIIGELDQYGEPETARLEWQDWGTQWTTEGIWSAQRNAEQAILTFARQFYYGG